MESLEPKNLSPDASRIIEKVVVTQSSCKDLSSKSSPRFKYIKKKQQDESTSPTEEAVSPTINSNSYRFTNKGKPPIILKKNPLQSASLNRLLKKSSPRPSFNDEILKEVDNLSNENQGTINNYELGPVIGQGSYSIVRKAVNKLSGGVFAVKTYDKIKISQEKCISIQKERKIMSQINHMNIVKLVEFIEEKNESHFIMELVPGISLYGYLKQHLNTRIEEYAARKIFSQIFSAIDYLHRKNISHGDLKLENILITNGGSIKIIDFGFSEYFDQKKTIFCGSFYYMSPEIVSFEEYFGGPADIWALGVILYAILTGTFPFKGSEKRDLYKKIKKLKVSMPDFLSPEAGKLINKLLQKECSTRPRIKDILNDPWLTCDGLGDTDVECKLSLSNSLIKDSSIRHDKRRNSGILSKNNSSWKKQVFTKMVTAGS